MIQHMKLKTILAVAVSLAAFVGNATELVNLEDGSTVTASQLTDWNGHTDGTSSKEAKAAYTLRFGGDVTIELDSNAAVHLYTYVGNSRLIPAGRMFSRSDLRRPVCSTPSLRRCSCCRGHAFL